MRTTRLSGTTGISGVVMRGLPGNRQAPAFIVSNTNPLVLEFALEYPVLFLDVRDDILLVAVDPASQRHKKQLPWLEPVHEHDLTRRVSFRNAFPGQGLRSAE